MPPKLQYTEEQLVQLLRSKSQEAFDVLYDNYSPALYGIILKIVPLEEAAQDVLQESFIKIWKNFANYDRSKGTLFTWMLNVSRNTAIDHNRSKHVKYQIRMNDDVVNTIEQRGTSTNTTDHIGLKEVVEALKPEHRQIIELLYFKGYTQDEASKELELPLGTLKTRARAAIMTLRNILKDNGI